MQGKDGDSGVYIGASAPTEESARVWIDTDEEADVMVTPQDVEDALTEAKEYTDNTVASVNPLDIYSIDETVIGIETQKTSTRQSNLEKEEWNWRNQPA